MLPRQRPHLLARACRAALAGVGMVLLLGCESTGPKVPTPAPALPAQYQNPNSAAPSQPSLGRAEPLAASRSQWWHALGSEELNQLVDRALAYNVDMRLVTQQLAQAQLRKQQAQGAGMPLITAPLRTAAQETGAGSSQNSQQSSQLALQGSYRLDLWGENKSLVESADMQVWRAVHERENMQRMLIATVVNLYVSHLSLNDSIEIARANEAVGRDLLRTVERRYALGDATSAELEQQRAALYVLQAVLPGLENQRQDLRSALARMVGALPRDVLLSERGLDSLQLPQVNTGVPSDLLWGRPDIRLSEARLRAAHANIALARARLLPPIDLSAQSGYSATQLAKLLEPQSFFWNAVASLTLSIFDGGRAATEKDIAKSAHEEMVESYGQTVFQAVREVESALTALKSGRQRLDAQYHASRAALKLFEISNQAYGLGSLDLATLLESRRSYQRQLDETLRMKAEVLRANVNLSQALGLGAVLPDLADVAEQTERPAARLAVQQGEQGYVVLGAGPVQASGFEVELPGLYHRSTLLPVWRDLQQRYAPYSATQVLRALPQGQPEDAPQQAWYRLRLANFATADAAQAFCTARREFQQGCKVLPQSADSAEGKPPSKGLLARFGIGD